MSVLEIGDSLPSIGAVLGEGLQNPDSITYGLAVVAVGNWAKTLTADELIDRAEMLAGAIGEDE
ncbi:MAG TPA: hypothetical protein VMT23_02215 [Candidatus Binatia bacterium]|nr:hypothetical protein [Candidatus Binatia bacterium]